MKIVVAMSGGVDSSVAALLLKQQGYQIIGISLRLTDNSEQKDKNRCCSFNDLTDARQVCDQLSIPFYVIDLRREFLENVIKPFALIYKSGKTPIPCITCNDLIKFGYLYKTAIKLKAQLATGHYAKIISYKGVLTIARPVDKTRDQTYYLYGTNSEIIQNLHFPLGIFHKREIREIAKQNQIKVYSKSDSNEICFVPNGNHATIVEKYAANIPAGSLINTDLTTISKHEGIHNFTIGQRRGLKIGGLKERSYVVDINPISNDVTIGSRSHLSCSKIKINKINILVPTSMWPKIVYVQIRSQHVAQRAHWQAIKDHNEIYLTFLESIFSISLGQSSAIYDENILLGGGIINGRLDGDFPRE